MDIDSSSLQSFTSGPLRELLLPKKRRLICEVVIPIRSRGHKTVHIRQKVVIPIRSRGRKRRRNNSVASEAEYEEVRRKRRNCNDHARSKIEIVEATVPAASRGRKRRRSDSVELRTEMGAVRHKRHRSDRVESKAETEAAVIETVGRRRSERLAVLKL